MSCQMSNIISLKCMYLISWFAPDNVTSSSWCDGNISGMREWSGVGMWSGSEDWLRSGSCSDVRCWCWSVDIGFVVDHLLLTNMSNFLNTFFFVGFLLNCFVFVLTSEIITNPIISHSPSLLLGCCNVIPFLIIWTTFFLRNVCFSWSAFLIKLKYQIMTIELYLCHYVYYKDILEWNISPWCQAWSWWQWRCYTQCPLWWYTLVWSQSCMWCHSPHPAGLMSSILALLLLNLTVFLFW